MICIYTIKSPSGKIYVGQAVDFDKRMRRYKILACKGQKKLYCSFVKYGFDSHEIKVAYEFPFDIDLSILNTYEELYIELYGNTGVELINLTKGGDGCRGYVYTDEDREVIRRGTIGKKRSEATRSKMSDYHKKRPKDHQVKLGKARANKVLQYSLSGEFIKEWDSLFEAANSGHGDVRACISGKQYKAGGYVWEYAKKKSKDIKEKIRVNKDIELQKEKLRRERISMAMKKAFIPDTEYLNL